MYFVYVLQSLKDGNRYTGISKDPEKRLKEHNSGLVTSTKKRKPFELVFVEKCKDRIAARKKEKYFKSGFGRKYIDSKLQRMGFENNRRSGSSVGRARD
ncbi:MAG: GIY-YIG nuclease family protein [Candidatus Omnitrophica bacterium]|nr:GIY-YIG nuclease family protein [Candidatus Omnitrophota bacterium]